MISLYEILVPTIMNNKPVRTRFHRVWDRKIRSIAGGLTILSPCKGQWISESAELFQERMIPVRIACTADQLKEILNFSLQYYNQIAMFAYKISDEVIIVRR